MFRRYYISTVLLFDFYFSERYFHSRKTRTILNANHKYWLHTSAGFIRRQIKEAYGKGRAKGVTRILFIGTSQIWGAGARNEAETIVRRIQDKFNTSALVKGRFECINAGISGYDASRLLNLYITEWLALEPQMVVIVLSNNDYLHSDIFSSALIRFVDLNTSKGIKTIFVLEANSIEMCSGELKLHSIMRHVAEENGVPALDLHGYLAQNSDKGFLWWDFVHLTSFGQMLAADFLFDGIKPYNERSFTVVSSTGATSQGRAGRPLP